MSIPKRPKDVMLVLSILYSDVEDIWGELLSELVNLLGPMEHISDPIPFTETTYYDKELGTPIFRKMAAFSNLIPPDRLPDIKNKTNELEIKFTREDGSRRFNLDPGILSFERFVLATGKEYTHRIYLKDGIWADLTLIFQKGKWQILPWTYPDYAKKDLQNILSMYRELYKNKLKK